MSNKNPELTSMIIQRRILGILCALLAPSSLLFGLFGWKYNLPNWYFSVSSTYYANSKIFMIGLLSATSIFFFAYKGYDWKDRICSLVQAISAIGLVVFPCATVGIPDNVGLFCLPVSISNTIHCIFATLLFLAFDINILFLFTLGNGEPTERKKLRNKIYYICGAIITMFMVCQAFHWQLSKILPDWFPLTLFNEFMMLEPFSFAYIVKSEAIGRFNDIKISSVKI